MALNFEARSGNSGDPGAAFWPILLCCGLILIGLLFVNMFMGICGFGGIKILPESPLFLRSSLLP